MMKNSSEMRTIKSLVIALVGILTLSSCGAEKKTKNVIPDGCELTVKETGELYESGETFPESIQPGDKLFDYEAGYEYVYAAVPRIDSYLTEDGADYVHLYDIQKDMIGWSVNVYDSGIEFCGGIRNEINGVPVINMDYCYYGCEKLKNFSEIPNSIVSMNGAFGRCYLLEKMPELPEGLISMSGTFEQCGFTEISNIPTPVEDLSYAFMDCKSLKVAEDIPNGVESMQGTFNGCSDLKTVGVIPESVKDISYCFTGCSKLEGDIFIHANPEKYDGCFMGTEKRIFVYGNENSDWMLLGEICKTVESGQFDNVVMPG